MDKIELLLILRESFPIYSKFGEVSTKLLKYSGTKMFLDVNFDVVSSGNEIWIKLSDCHIVTAARRM